jgi:CDP-diacylglycerol--glycerol-3-phosphate 3-phosphatidyltransferase
MKSSNLNLPNLLSLSRIVFLPLLYFFAWMGASFEFLIAYIIIGATDALDGFLARLLKQVTSLGKVLDTVADILFYFSTLYFLLFFYPQIIISNIPLLIIFLVFYIGAYLYSWIKFKRPIQIHTNHLRLNATFIYFLVIISYFMDTTWVVSFILISFMIAYIEEILIFYFYGAVDIDTRSIWQLIKKNKNKNLE